MLSDTNVGVNIQSEAFQKKKTGIGGTKKIVSPRFYLAA
jgi:hypothetical protein